MHCALYVHKFYCYFSFMSKSFYQASMGILIYVYLSNVLACMHLPSCVYLHVSHLSYYHHVSTCLLLSHQITVMCLHLHLHHLTIYRFAASQGVHWYTFDSEYEIQKIAEIDPAAKLLVRLKVDNQLSVSFQVHSKLCY